MMYELYYAGKPLSEFGLVWDNKRIFDKPKKLYTKYDIPARNGDLIEPNNKYENVQIAFRCFIATDYKNNINKLVNYLNSFDTYQRLENTMEPDVFRMGVFHSAVEPTTGDFALSGWVNITFDCMPQAFFKSGEDWINLPRTIENPSYMKARPLFKFENITAPFTVAANGTTIIQYTSAVRMVTSRTENGLAFVANGTTLTVRKVGTPQEIEMFIPLGSARLAPGQYRFVGASYGTLKVQSGGTVISTGGTFTLTETTQVNVIYTITPTASMPAVITNTLLLMPLGTLYVDCGLMDCYMVNGDTAYSHNESIDLPADYIELGESTRITTTGNPTCYIMPRWWRL